METIEKGIELKEEKKQVKGVLRGMLYYISILLMPSIMLFDLYNRNHMRNLMLFEHILILAGLLAIVGVILFVVFKFLVRSIEGALLISLVFWLAFWMFETLLSMARIITTLAGPRRLMVLILLFLICLIMVIRRYKPPFKKAQPVFNVLASCIIALFVFNIIPSISHEATLARARSELESIAEDSRFKQNFNVDVDLPSPDIHWFHLDGLISIEKIESFWGEDYESLRVELKQRGFTIYENGLINAASTQLAMPALWSPTFYDVFWGELLAEFETRLSGEQHHIVVTELAQEGFTFWDDLVPNFELFNALVAKGYELVRTPSAIHYPFFEMEEDRVEELGMLHQFIGGDIPELLSRTTPLNVTSITERFADEYGGSSYSENEMPRFFLYAINETHGHRFTHYSNEDMGESVPTSNFTESGHDYTRYDLYPLAFERVARWMLYHIDVILEENPYAVIVLQGDHGVHIQGVQEHLLDQGYPLDIVLELTYSVFSAVRIPDEYGGLEVPLAPLNITRELVNRFVGENYELLPSRDD